VQRNRSSLIRTPWPATSCSMPTRTEAATLPTRDRRGSQAGAAELAAATDRWSAGGELEGNVNTVTTQEEVVPANPRNTDILRSRDVPADRRPERPALGDSDALRPEYRGSRGPYFESRPYHL
jgi:hypothetical protein